MGPLSAARMRRERTLPQSAGRGQSNIMHINVCFVQVFPTLLSAVNTWNRSESQITSLGFFLFLFFCFFLDKISIYPHSVFMSCSDRASGEL